MEIAMRPMSLQMVLGHVFIWLFFLVVVRALAKGRAAERLSPREMWLIALPIIIGASLAFAFSQPVDVDEAEHIHSAWLISEGHVPFEDFFCTHSPLLHHMLAPVMRVLPHSAVVLDVSRVLSLLLTVAASVVVLALSRQLWGREHDLWAIGLLLGAVVWSQMYWIRPDVAATVLTLGAVLALSRSRGPLNAAAAGALLGTAVCFTPKHLPLLALGPLLALWAWRTEPSAGSRRHWHEAAAFIGGAIVPMAMFAGWLSHIGLLDSYHEWVMAFNRQVQLTWDAEPTHPRLPLVVTALAVAGFVLLQKAGRLHTGRTERAIVVAVLLSLPMALARRWTYDSQVTVLLAAALGAGPARWAWGYMAQRSVLVASLALMLSFAHVMPRVAVDLVRMDYFQERALVRALIDVAGDEPVICVGDCHPLVSHDATDLWQYWQWEFFLAQPPVQQRLRGFADEVLARPPPIVFHREARGTGFFEGLLKAEIISEQEADRLGELFASRYRVVALKSRLTEWLWIRNDRLGSLPPDMEAEILPPGATAEDGVVELEE